MFDRSAMIFMGLLAGALLGHPVIGMVGGLVCSGSVTALILSLLFGYYNTVRNVLLKVPCLVIGVCGLVSIGRFLTKHRVFLCFHLRRLCRALVSMRRSSVAEAMQLRKMVCLHEAFLVVANFGVKLVLDLLVADCCDTDMSCL